MAESTIVKTKLDGTVQFAALGGGAYNTTTGALEGGAESYTAAFENGDLSFTPSSRTVQNYKDRGRITSPPSLRYGDDVEGTLSMTMHLRDLTDASAATMADIGHFLTGNPTGYVGSNWETTMASSAGAGDAEVYSIGMKLTITNAGDGTDTHSLVLNYVTGSITLTEGDPSNLSLDFVVNDKPEEVTWL